MTIRVKVLYFAEAREAAGTGEEEFSLPTKSSVAALVGTSIEAHPRLKGMGVEMRVAVNEELAADEDVLEDGDVVAFLPAVAGG